MNDTCYPFNLDGSLCPLLNDREVLAGFYADESLRHGIKNFCKKTVWPGKPPVAFAIDPALLQDLLLSLFNSPVGRARLRASRATYLDNAIWQWLSVTHPALAERVSRVCVDVKGRLFLKPAALATLLQSEPASLPLAYVVLAFAMLQPDDRQALGETFLKAFPDYAAKFGTPTR